MKLFGTIGMVRALARIADALERLAPPPPGKEGDQSSVTYVDDRAAWELEQRQEDYFRQTGRMLGDGEEPPKHG